MLNFTEVVAWFLQSRPILRDSMEDVILCADRVACPTVQSPRLRGIVIWSKLAAVIMLWEERLEHYTGKLRTGSKNGASHTLLCVIYTF